MCQWRAWYLPFKSYPKSTNEATTLGGGRSVLMAAIANRVENELNEEPNWTLQYVSCESLQNSTGLDARNDSSLSSTRVKNTLVCNLYEQACTDQIDTTLLEKCNDVFHNSKRKKASAALTQHKVAEELPEFDEALEELSQALKKKVIIIIDAVEMISDDQEEDFASSLQDLLKRTGMHTRIIVSSFSGCKFYATLEKNNTPNLSLGEHNREVSSPSLRRDISSFSITVKVRDRTNHPHSPVC